MYKTIVIGGGASGLAACAYLGNDSLILERNEEVGKKILATGNGRCNYTNNDQNIKHYNTLNDEDIKKIINPENIKLMHNFFNVVGFIPRIKNDYYYPYSNQASSIRNTLLSRIKNNQVNIKYNAYVIDIKKNNNTYLVKTTDATYQTKNIIIAAGSMADSKTGSDGSGYKILEKLNLNVIKPLPALVQLQTNTGLEKEWAGIRCEVKIANYENNKLIKEEIGELQFTNYGISGICAMQLSTNIARGLDKKMQEEVVINFLNGIDINKKNAKEFLENRAKVMNTSVLNMLYCLVNAKLLNVMLNYLKINAKTNYLDLTENDQNKLINFLTNYKVKIMATNSFNQAQICSGGLNLSEINLDTMELKKYPGIYVVGELLNVHGDCGGYNLSLAWITGILASKAISND